MIDGKNFFDQPVKNDLRTYKNIWKIATAQGDYYTAGCLLDYNCFSENNELIETDLRKQQALDADTKAIQQINFTGNLDQSGQTAMSFIIEKSKENILDFSQETVRVYLLFLF